METQLTSKGFVTHTKLPLMHENDDISDVDKVAYFFELSEGPAYLAVKGFRGAWGYSDRFLVCTLS